MIQSPRIGEGRHRSIFISDVHLGTRSCRAEQLLAFLTRVHAEHLYLVGDILDLMSLSSTFLLACVSRRHPSCSPGQSPRRDARRVTSRATMTRNSGSSPVRR